MMRKLSVFRRLTMPLSELEKYCLNQRKIRFEHNIPLSGIKVRRLVHYRLLSVLRLRQLITGISIIVLNDKRKKTARPVIYACTHIGWNDVEVAYCALRDPSWLLLGDPRELYRSIDGLMLRMNGVICIDSASKEDRFIGRETCVKLLRQGGNLLIFPEGAWNISKNQIVMKLFTGAAEMAIRTRAEIVPVAIEQYGKRYVVNIGSNIDCFKYDISQKQILTDQIRDAMCTLKWEIIEKYAVDNRSNITQDYWDGFLSNIETQMRDAYSLEDIEVTRYHTRAEIEQRDASLYIDKLVPCRENAFLLRIK